MDLEHCFKYLKSLPKDQIEELLCDFYESIPNNFPTFSHEKSIKNYHDEISLCSIAHSTDCSISRKYSLVTIGIGYATKEYYLDCKNFINSNHKEHRNNQLQQFYSAIRKHKIKSI